MILSETVGSESAKPPSPMRSLLWLAAAAVLLPFANGRDTIAVAAWLAPVFLLRFVRSRNARSGLLFAWLALTGAFALQFRGMVPIPGVWYFVLAVVYGLVETLPYIADRLLTPRIGGFAATFILPCAWVTTEYLTARFTPYGSWGSAAYSQYENLALLQIVSITGLYGVSFLIAWFAAGCNWVWESHFAWEKVRHGVIGFSSVLLAALVFGGARLALLPVDGSTVRVASLTKADIDLFPSPETAQRAMTDTLTDDEMDEIRRRGNAINDDLFRRAETEAQTGAKIVFWGETNAFVFKEDEPSFIERGAELARAQGIYLGLAVATWDRAGPKPLENKLVFIDPHGKVVWEIYKAIPVPGPEATISALDDGRLRIVETPHGRIGAVICFDMDFPELLKQAGRLRTDIMLVPSNDWKEIDPWHSQMARFRAVEQGFNLVRHTSNGLSLAADYHGRVLNSMDHFTTTDRVLISHVPIQGVATIYSRIGDAFAWVCIAALIASLVSAGKFRANKTL